MASLRDTVKEYQEELRDGIAWRVCADKQRREQGQEHKEAPPLSSGAA